jgi:hypothetical protein
MVLVVATRPEGEEGPDQRKKKTHDKRRGLGSISGLFDVLSC